MNETQSKKVISYLEKMLASVDDKSMVWHEANPTTYVFHDKKTIGKIVIQKISPSMRRTEKGVSYETNYMLQATSNSSPQQFTIQSTDGDKYHMLLKQIFKAIETMEAQESIDFLGSMLD